MVGTTFLLYCPHGITKQLPMFHLDNRSFTGALEKRIDEILARAKDFQRRVPYHVRIQDKDYLDDVLEADTLLGLTGRSIDSLW